METDAANRNSTKDLFRHAYDYCLDAWQRSILFTDILRKRGNNYHEHLEKGQPPVVIFDYDTVLDAREFEQPVNFILAKIKDRRRNGSNNHGISRERRANVNPEESEADREAKRPLVIFDPRAGHGAGIGGSKEASEIGLALSFGHDVYFVYFTIEPIPGQTLTDVKNAQIRFLEEIVSRHPDAPRPAVIGNCQGGWSSALLAACRPDLVGPLMMNGAPLSYWAGSGYKSTMRYLGGLIGGVWADSLIGDLGGGQFDGANLVMNMELATFTANYWSKFYNLYARADTEEKRYLDYERWSSAYFRLTTEEIHQIAGDLFIGNKLEQDALVMDDGEKIDLRKIEDPVLVFASEGDDIAPPQQALYWIPRIYGSVEEIKRQQQVVIYMVHPSIGHLGIFVSSSIANKEQQEIIGGIEMIDSLLPGLYEMIITKEPSKNWMNDYHVRFEEREMEDILAFGGYDEDRDALRRVSALSEINDNLYRMFVSPWIKPLVTEPLAEWMRHLHPMRLQRSLISDRNPALKPVKEMAEFVNENRKPVPEDNVFLQMEKNWFEFGKDWLDIWQDTRNFTQQTLFRSIYSNSLWDLFLPKNPHVSRDAKARKKQQKADSRKDTAKWMALMEEGGFAEGVIRMMLAMIREDQTVDEKEMKMASEVIHSHQRLKDLPIVQLKQIAKEQARILQTDEVKALEALDKLLQTPEECREAYELAERIASADSPTSSNERKMLDSFKRILQL